MLFLHAGHGKAGSSTIQAFLRENEAKLLAHGLVYVRTGRNDRRHLPLERAVADPGTGSEMLEQFSAEVDAFPGCRFVVSSEGFLRAIDAADRSGIDRLTALELKVIFYLREYGDRARSLYAQATKRGRNIKAFDEFFADRQATRSPLHHLKEWSALIGWQNMRLKSIDKRSLVGGDLVSDFLTAIGIEDDTGFTRPVAQNVSPDWIALEYGRALHTAFANVEKEQAKPAIRVLMKHLAANYRPDEWTTLSARYLTANQAFEAASEYNRDVDELNSLNSFEIPKVPVDDFPQREFLPTLVEVPRPLRKILHDRAPVSAISKLSAEAASSAERFLEMLLPS